MVGFIAGSAAFFAQPVMCAVVCVYIVSRRGVLGFLVEVRAAYVADLVMPAIRVLCIIYPGVFRIAMCGCFKAILALFANLPVVDAVRFPIT